MAVQERQSQQQSATQLIAARAHKADANDHFDQQSAAPQAGDKVNFTVDKINGAFTVLSIEPRK